MINVDLSLDKSEIYLDVGYINVSWLIQASISRLYQPNPYIKYGWFNYEAAQG